MRKTKDEILPFRANSNIVLNVAANLPDSRDKVCFALVNRGTYRVMRSMLARLMGVDRASQVKSLRAGSHDVFGKLAASNRKALERLQKNQAALDVAMNQDEPRRNTGAASRKRQSTDPVRGRSTRTLPGAQQSGADAKATLHADKFRASLERQFEREGDVSDTRARRFASTIRERIGTGSWSMKADMPVVAKVLGLQSRILAELVKTLIADLEASGGQLTNVKELFAFTLSVA
ncbi:MAG: hypothetical protein EOO22_06640, partial [Comamonadaceae bacterium]